MQPFRIEPQGPAELYKTYRISAPVSTHFRPATCAETECLNYTKGWKTVVDESTDLGRAQARFIRLESKRKAVESKDPTGLTVFVFEPGQRCFTQHQIRLDRDPTFSVQEGDFRGNPRGGAPRIFKTAEDWRDEFAEHQETLADRLEQG